MSNVDIIGFLVKVRQKVYKEQEIMRRHGFVIDNLQEPWQKLAFTLYTDIASLSTEAEQLLAVITDNDGYSANPYGDPESPLFAKGAPPPVLFEGCAAGCHTGKHSHHSHVPWMYGDPYNHTCVRCGHAAAGNSYGADDETYLCDCCWEDWGEIYQNSTMAAFIKIK